MRTIKGTEDLITGIIIGLKKDNDFERKAAKLIMETLIEENNLNIPPVISPFCGYVSDGYRPPCYMNKDMKCDDCCYKKQNDL